MEIKLINDKYFFCSHDITIGDYVFAGQKEYFITTLFEDEEIPLAVVPPNSSVGSMEDARNKKAFKIVSEVSGINFNKNGFYYTINSFIDIDSIQITNLSTCKKEWVKYSDLKF